MSELGFYSAGNSYLHKLHPTTKIVVFGIFITILPIVVKHWQANVAMILIICLIIWSARIGRKQILYFSPAIGLVIISAVSWFFTNVGGNVVFDFKIGNFHYVLRDKSVQQAVAMSTKASVWVLAYMALLTSTNTRELMVGLEKLKLPRKASIAVGMTLKFWANVINDTQNVMDAQRVRGVDFDHGPKLKLLKQRFIVATVPTIFLMLKRFRTVSFALALRGFGAPGEKTRVFEPDFSKKDKVFIGVSASILLIIGLLDYLG